MSDERRWRCSNCGETWTTRATARACCSSCDRIIRHPTVPNAAGVCGKKRVWSAPMSSHMFPLGYCADHVPESVRAALEEAAQ